MPRFHFHVFDGVDAPDEGGQELDSWDEARLVAIRAARELLEDRAGKDSLDEGWHMEVTDEYGFVRFRLDFRIDETPTLLGRGCARDNPE